MNKIWKYLMIITICFGLFHQKADSMMEGVLTSPMNAFELVLSIVINGSLWNGVLNIAQTSGLLESLSKLLSPIFGFIYKDIKHTDNALQFLTTNFIANLFGLGALATMSGLKAMKRLDEINESKDKPSRAMMTLMIFNTTGFSLFPTTILGVRLAYGSSNPSDFIPYIILIGLIALLIGLGIQRVIDRG